MLTFVDRIDIMLQYITHNCGDRQSNTIVDYLTHRKPNMMNLGAIWKTIDPANSLLRRHNLPNVHTNRDCPVETIAFDGNTQRTIDR